MDAEAADARGDCVRPGDGATRCAPDQMGRLCAPCDDDDRSSRPQRATRLPSNKPVADKIEMVSMAHQGRMQRQEALDGSCADGFPHQFHLTSSPKRHLVGRRLGSSRPVGGVRP